MSNPYGPNAGSAVFDLLRAMVDGASNGDVPTWNAATGQFEPAAPPGAGGGATIEEMQDDLGNTSLIGGDGIDKVYDDEITNTITLAVDATVERTTNKGVASGYASLDGSGTVPDAQIPSTITRDSELAAHEADTTSVHGIADTAALLDTGDIGTTVQPFDADLTALAAAENSAVLAATNASFTTADETKLDGIEAGAEVNPSNAEIETAYNTQVAAASQAEAEAGTETAIRRWSPLRVAQAIAALAPAGGGGPTAGSTFDGTDGSRTYGSSIRAIVWPVSSRGNQNPAACRITNPGELLLVQGRVRPAATAGQTVDLSIEVDTAGGASDAVYIVFYAVTPDGGPGTFIDSFLFSGAGTTGVKTIVGDTWPFDTDLYVWGGVFAPATNSGAPALSGVDPSSYGMWAGGALDGRGMLLLPTNVSTPPASLATVNVDTFTSLNTQFAVDQSRVPLLSADPRA